MAKFKVTVQYSNKPSTEYETDDEKLANSFLVRELQRVKETGSKAVAIFFNNELKWRKR